MPAHNARVFVRLMDWSKAAPALDGQLKFRVEYSLLDGAREDGKFSTVVSSISDSQGISRDIIDGLIAYLNAKYPTARYREHDIVVWGS